MIQNVCLRDGRFDAFEMQQVGHVSNCAIGHQRDDAQSVAIIQNLGNVGSVADECALQQAAGKAYGPLVRLGFPLCLGRRRYLSTLRPLRAAAARSQHAAPTRRTAMPAAQFSA